MGRFLGPSPMAGADNTRRGRRYEALPAENEDDDGRSPREANVTEEQQSDAEPAASNPRSNSRSALMRSDSEASEQAEEEGEEQGNEEKQQPQLHRQQADEAGEEALTAKAEDAAKVATPETNQSAETTDAPVSSEQQADGAEADNGETEGGEPEALEAGMIQVRILDLNGKFFTIPCRLDWTVALMKAKVLESTEVPVTSQRLIYRGRVLEDNECLSTYKVEDGHTIHLFVRMAPTPDPEGLSAEATSNATGNGSGIRGDDGSGMAVVTINETVSSAVFPSDSARRVDPLMLDSPLGNCARRVKLWSSFLLIIYTMKVMGQFALLANDQQQSHAQEAGENGGASGTGEDRPMMNRYNDYPQYYTPDPLVGGLELLVHAFGVYVGCVGFKAAHDTDIRPIRFYCRGVVWLALLTMVEQIYTTVKISQADFSTSGRSMHYPYGASQPSKEDIVSANIFQAIMLVIMWLIAIRHSYLHQREVTAYNQSFAAAAMNAAPPVALPADVV